MIALKGGGPLSDKKEKKKKSEKGTRGKEGLVRKQRNRWLSNRENCKKNGHDSPMRKKKRKVSRIR